MKTKARFPLACTAIAVSLGILAFAASAAVAAVWKHHGQNVQTPIQISLVGGEVFESGTSGMACEVSATITTSGGSTGTFTKWEVKNCSGGSGDLAGCTVQATEAKNLPWTLHLNATDLSVTSVRIRRVFNAGCPITEIDKTVTMTMTPDAACTIKELEFQGATTGYQAFGSLTVVNPTYCFG
jgi:hypothetical protein